MPAGATARAGASAAGPVLHGPRSTALTYEAFYGLKEKPFSLTSDSRFFYQSRSHAPAFEDLLAGIRRRESLCALTGDIGTGKTTLCRTVLQNLDRKTFSAFVPDPFASREDLLKVLLMDFGVLSVDDLTSGRLKGASRTELSYLLYEFLATLAPLQAFAVVIIDEAQNLSVPLLEEIRILSDSDGRERQLQVVLVGQLELRQKLKLPEMRQVDQRISVHCRLEPLGRDGVAGYIAHRLHIAGGSPDRVTFSTDAIEALYRVSGGVPRLINRICDRALYQGYLRRAATIDLEILEAATSDVDEPAAVPAAAPAIVPPVSVMPPQIPVTPSVPDFRLSEDSHDPINDWLAYAEEKAPPLAPPQRAAPPPRAPNVAGPTPRLRSGQAGRLDSSAVWTRRSQAGTAASRIRPANPHAADAEQVGAQRWHRVAVAHGRARACHWRGSRVDALDRAGNAGRASGPSSGTAALDRSSAGSSPLPRQPPVGRAGRRLASLAVGASALQAS